MQKQDDNVLDQFSEETSSKDGINNEDTDVFGDESSQEKADDKSSDDQGEAGDKDGDDSTFRNRHVRRLEAKLASERESNIRLSERIQSLSEREQFLRDTRTGSVDERLLTLYGNDDNGRKAAELTQGLLEDTAKRARSEALEEFKKQQQESDREVDDEQEHIFGQLEVLEDEYKVDLTSDSPRARKNRNEFLDYLVKLSPKDNDGDVIEYADFGETFSEWQRSKNQSQSSTRSKDIAARGMSNSGTSTDKTRDLQGERFLKESGII